MQLAASAQQPVHGVLCRKGACCLRSAAAQSWLLGSSLRVEVVSCFGVLLIERFLQKVWPLAAWD